MATKILQGDLLLLKVFIDPIIVYENRNFARGSPTEIYLFIYISLVKVVSVSITEGNNRNILLLWGVVNEKRLGLIGEVSLVRPPNINRYSYSALCLTDPSNAESSA